MQPAPDEAHATSRLLAQVTCPHCWERFPPEQVLWVSEHVELHGDPKINDAQQRFLPTRFTTDGNALDPKGMVCRRLACPRCHLEIPRGMLELEPLFISIVGAPYSGKSYFLTAMTRQLRNVLFQDFALSFHDADPVANGQLHGAEMAMFENAESDRLIPLYQLIPKTMMTGDRYDEVAFGQQRVRYPRPFLFALQPRPEHPNARKAERLSCMLCLYDNAGEHFLPGNDTTANPGTRHLAMSRAILFLFDPTQDHRFRALCRGGNRALTADGRPQIQQMTLLHEVAARVRLHIGLGPHARFDRPLIIILTKYDEWAHVLGPPDDGLPWKKRSSEPVAGLDTDRIDQRSQALRQLMVRHCPEAVAAAEGFARDITYLPVSSLGNRIEVDPATGAVAIRPRDIRPFWAAVPLLYCLGRTMHGLIPRVVRKVKGA